MTDQSKRGFFRRNRATDVPAPSVAVEQQPEEERAELPIVGSPYVAVNAVNLSGTAPSRVSVDRALGLASVYRAVSIIGTSVCQLPVGVWRAGAEIDAPALIKSPNLDLSLQAFLEQTAVSLAVSGNAYWRLYRSSPTATVTNVEVLNPHQMFVETNDQGRKVYRYGDKTFQPWQIKHLWLTRIPGYEYGIGPIQASQNELRGAIDLRNYSDQWFANGGVPNGVLSTDQDLNSQQADDIRKRWNKIQDQQGRGVAVLGKGVAYQPVYLSPADAQFIESQQFSTTQVARMFGIPATYMLAGVEGNSVTYTNLETVDAQFVKYTLTKYLTEIETALSALLPRGQEVRFKLEGLLRGDLKNRLEAYKTGIEAGILTINEVRALEGRPPLDDPKPQTPTGDLQGGPE